MATRKTKIITFVVLATFLFFCKGASLNSFTHNMVMDHEGSMSMPCCDIESSASTEHTMGEALLPSKETFAMVILGVAFALLASVARLIDHLFRYLVDRRRRFGSFALLNYFTLLFRRGILHPKTF